MFEVTKSMSYFEIVLYVFFNKSAKVPDNFKD